MHYLVSKLFRANAPTPYRQALAQAEEATRARKWQLAAEAFTKAFDLSPKSTHLLIQIGHCRKELGEYSVASEYYARYLKEHPDDHDTRRHLMHVNAFVHGAAPISPSSQALAGNGTRMQHAASSLSPPGKELSPVTRQEALTLFDTRQWEAAAAALEAVCDASPASQDLLCLLGHARKENGEFTAARRAYDRYMAFAQAQASWQTADAYLQLGHLSKIEGNLMQAMNFYIKANENLTDDAPAVAQDVKREIQELSPLIFPTFSLV